MTPAPRVSIVIPVFNDEETIAAALESCLAQTMTDVEVVCVDDASSDYTVAVIEQYQAKDPRIRLILQERNMSAFQARRTGILAATGQYLLFLDGDDELYPDTAEKSLTAARKHDADLVGFSVEVVGTDGGIVGGYQRRLTPQHAVLNGPEVLARLFPVNQPAQGQLWRYLFRTDVVRDAYDRLPADLVLPRVNDLPVLFLVAALSKRYVSVEDRLYRYHYGRGGSGRAVDTVEQAQFYAEAIRSVESIAPAIRSISRASNNPTPLLDSYESVRLSIIGYVCSYLFRHTPAHLLTPVLEHLHTRASPTDLAVAAATFYPDSLDVLKKHSHPAPLGRKPVRNILLATRALTTGGVSNVLLTQAALLTDAGYGVTIVARRSGTDRSATPKGTQFIEMAGRGLPERLAEWAEICRANDIDVIIDHQVLYSRDWPEYALIARGLGIATLGWIHNFAGRPLYDLNGLHGLLKENASLLETVVTLSPLDVAFWKLRGTQHAVYLPNPPSPLLLEPLGPSARKQLPSQRLHLIWWGRLDEHTKQVSQLIDVADQLRMQSVDFRLTVIGPDWADWTAERFNAAARKRSLEHHVVAIGERRGQQLIDLIDDADAFITTSLIEGYQLTITEAQSRGLPVFMYELPWLTVVQDNQGIVAVRQGDSPALARAIAQVASSPERYEELSRASLAAAQRALGYDFRALYEQAITGSLPAEFSPEPTLDDAQKLLDLMIIFAERGVVSRTRSTGAADARRRAKNASTLSVAPNDTSLGQRAWRVAQPVGRAILQLFPGLRPLAHRAKSALLRPN